MENHQKNIEDYLSGLLNEADKIAFEARIISDDEFREAYEMEVASRKLVKIAGRNHLKARLNKLDDLPEAKIVRPFFSSKRLLLIASLIIGLVASFWVMQSSLTKNTHQELFAEYFQKYRSPSMERGDDSATKNNWESGIESYEQGQYEEAINGFEAAVSSDQAPEYLIHFYLGQSHLAKDTPDARAAIASFEKVMGDNFYQEPAKWYMALAHLKLGELDKSKTILQKLSGFEHSKKEAAKALLKSLK